MQSVKKVDVLANNTHVGTLVEHEGKVLFQYSPSFIENGFSISPFSLPLTNELFTPKGSEFEGLFGIFHDSLPDGWGRLLTDRYLLSKGIDRNEINILTRLCMLNEDATGNLEYHPRMEARTSYSDDDFDKLFTDAQNLLRNTELKEKDLDQLYEKGGSSGGARPKVNVLYDKEPWLVKFPSSFDGDDAGEKEYECNLRAADAGINVAKFKLIESKITKGFFASKRFDRIDGKRIHMASLSAILESSHRYPALDYYHLLKVTEILTHSEKETEEAFRRACFNVFIENQDDHGKNFAFLYDDGKREWHLSPAYDITSTQTSFGEHSTTVMKKGKSISSDDLRRLADEFTIKQSVREEILRDTWKAAKA